MNSSIRSMDDMGYMSPAYMHAPGARNLRSSMLDRRGITATRIKNDKPTHGSAEPFRGEDAFMLSYKLGGSGRRFTVDGKLVKTSKISRGQFRLFDFNRSWQTSFRCPVNVLNVHIPRSSIAGLEEELGTRGVETFTVAPGASVDDPVIRGLMEAILPAFDESDAVSTLFFDHVGLALCSHLILNYGTANSKPIPNHGGLAPWQIARATELIDSRLDGKLQVADLAAACRLSPSHFARAFKISMGLSPYQWMMKRRIDKAKDLMKTTRLSLSEVSVACGFVDQSHLTREFGRMIGASPGRWRRHVLR